MKIDLHIHSYHSKDSVSKIEKIAKTIKEKGLDGFSLTDHDTGAGWKEGEIIAKKYGLFFIRGEEIKTKKNGMVIGDIIGIFLKKEIKSREPKAVIKEIKEQGGIAIIPHPFHILTPFKGQLEKESERLITPFTGDLEEYKKIIDAIETFNARVITRLADEKAYIFAKQNKIAMVGGSDAHYWKDAGDGYTFAPYAKNLEDFKKAILEKRTRGEGKKTPLRSMTIPAIARIKTRIEREGKITPKIINSLKNGVKNIKKEIK